MTEDIYFDGVPALAYGLQLRKCTIDPPVKKTKYLDIVGADGTLDLMHGMGPARYKRRKVVAEFVFCGNASAIAERVINLLDEREMSVVLPIKSAYYVIGLIHVKGASASSSGGMIMEIDCMPWLLRRDMTVVDVAASTTAKEYILFNQGRREAVPEIIAFGSIHVESGDTIVDLQAGTYFMPWLMINSFSQRTVSIRGAGCMIQYREAVLL